jgi:hypothetical protein
MLYCEEEEVGRGVHSAGLSLLGWVCIVVVWTETLHRDVLVPLYVVVYNSCMPDALHSVRVAALGS